MWPNSDNIQPRFMQWIAPAADVPCEELGDDAHFIAALFVVRRVVNVPFDAELRCAGSGRWQYGVNVCSETAAGDIGAGLGADGWQVIQHGGISQMQKGRRSAQRCSISG